MKTTTRAVWDGYWAGWCGGLGVYWLLKGSLWLGIMGLALSAFLLWISHWARKM